MGRTCAMAGIIAITLAGSVSAQEVDARTILPYANAWVSCTLAKADSFALQPEPIETIIVAIFAACSEVEQELIKAIGRAGLASQKDEILRDAHKTAVQELTLEILKKRAQ